MMLRLRRMKLHVPNCQHHWVLLQCPSECYAEGTRPPRRLGFPLAFFGLLVEGLCHEVAGIDVLRSARNTDPWVSSMCVSACFFLDAAVLCLRSGGEGALPSRAGMGSLLPCQRREGKKDDETERRAMREKPLWILAAVGFYGRRPL